ncbi:MAG: hypothetical protein WD226_09840 [Planctomycetota bacterium]
MSFCANSARLAILGVMVFGLSVAPITASGGKGSLRAGNGDGVGTLPITAGLPTGLALTGSVTDLGRVVASVNQAPLSVVQLEGERWGLLFGPGSLVDLDRAHLAKSHVRAFLVAGPGLGGAHATIGLATGFVASVELDADAPLEVPLGQLFAPHMTLPTLIVDALYPEGEGAFYRTVFAPNGPTLRIGQAVL